MYFTVLSESTKYISVGTRDISPKGFAARAAVDGGTFGSSSLHG